jgi:hypothetical protein
MIATWISRTTMRSLVVGGVLSIAFCLPLAAQVQTNKTVATGQATKEVTVERGEIVYVSGNNVVIKRDDGELLNFNNVPDNVTVTVDGKQLNVHQIKPGMMIEKQVIRTTTPRVITTVQTVTGKVFHVSPPNSVILTLENGKNERFTIPKGQKFMINGQETDAWGLKKGMVVSAQKVVEEPETVVEEEVKRTGTMPPPPPAPKADVPMLIVFVPVAHHPVEAAAAEPAPKKLPTTASNLPLIGLLGALLCALSLTVMAIRIAGSRLARLRS